jgi:3-methyl-2-oxobutanoate hydroxymethyltransferase
MLKNAITQIQKKKGDEKIAMITCYDYSFAKILDGLVDLILVGDSLGHVLLGHSSTAHVTMQDILRHVEAVRRGAPNTFIIGDLPAGSYESPESAIENAQQIMKAGADAIKPEGKPEIIQILTDKKIPVMAHLGYLPQTAEKFVVVGRKEEEAANLLQQALLVQQAGAFAVVLECIPAQLAKNISQKLDIPTIGIGSGVDCDGQVLVLYDLLGLYTDFKPKFVRKYLDLADLVNKAVKNYVKDIKSLSFPAKNEEYE